MAIICETENFIVESHEEPFVSRTDGGHVRIRVKDGSITDRTKLEPAVAIELMRLTMVVGEALEISMNTLGIPVLKVNYQDMGNWAYKTGKRPFLHVHVFGRAENATKQVWPESVYLPARESGFYEGFEPLNGDDRKKIRKNIEEIFRREKYQDANWKL